MNSGTRCLMMGISTVISPGISRKPGRQDRFMTYYERKQRKSAMAGIRLMSNWDKLPGFYLM